MKTVWKKNKWLFLFFINVFPFAIDVAFYRMGASLDLKLFLPVFIGLTVLNFINCKKVIPYILYQMLILVCIICSGYVSTYLYYNNISSDDMTLAIGELMVMLGSAINIVITLITAIVKYDLNKNREMYIDIK